MSLCNVYVLVYTGILLKFYMHDNVYSTQSLHNAVIDEHKHVHATATGNHMYCKPQLQVCVHSKLSVSCRVFCMGTIIGVLNSECTYTAIVNAIILYKYIVQIAVSFSQVHCIAST